MTFEHKMPQHRNRSINSEQEALIDRALKGGRISEADAGILHAVALYGDPASAARAEEALAKPRKGGRR